MEKGSTQISSKCGKKLVDDKWNLALGILKQPPSVLTQVLSLQSIESGMIEQSTPMNVHSSNYHLHSNSTADVGSASKICRTSSATD